MTAFFHTFLLICYTFSSFKAINHAEIKKFHPLHVSTADISYNAREKKMEVTCTIFTDDLEAALEKQFHTKADLLSAAAHRNMDVLIKNYINNNLAIRTSAGTVSLGYLGFEVNRESVDIYMESSPLPLPKRIDASVSLLYNLFNDQMNIVHITVNGVRKSTKLDYPEKKVTQQF